MKDRIVCWCGGIRVSDIIRAVKAGARTPSEVREFTGKKRQGFCEVENPKGVSCEEEFQRVIDEVIRKEQLRVLEFYRFR